MAEKLSWTEYNNLLSQYHLHSADASASIAVKRNSANQGRFTAEVLMGYMRHNWDNPIDMDAANEIIHKFDSTGVGRLNVEDFTSLAAFMETSTVTSTQSAARVAAGYDDVATTSFVSSIQLLRPLPKFFSNSDIRLLLDSGDGGSGRLNPKYLKRQIKIRGLKLRHLVARHLKPRFPHGLALESVDPLVAIQFLGVEQRTAALIGNCSPEWNQTFTFDVDIHGSDVFQVSQWVAEQRFTITVYDYCNEGPVPHLKLIGSACIPLEWILLIPTHSADIKLSIGRGDGVALSGADEAQMHLHITCVDNHSVPYSHIKDLYFSTAYSATELPVEPSDANEVIDSVPDASLRKLIAEVGQQISLFPRRRYPALVMVEGKLASVVDGLFRISLQPAASSSIFDVAFAIANFSISNAQPLLTESIASPFSILMKRGASLLEKSLLLAGILLQLGLPAFVCCGSSRTVKSTWVSLIWEKTTQTSRDLELKSLAILKSFDIDSGPDKSRQSVSPNPNAHSIIHFDMSNGLAWTSCASSKFSIETCSMIFNDRDIWLNSQSTVIVKSPNFSWLLSNSALWRRITIKTGQPSLIDLSNPWRAMKARSEEEYLLGKVVESVQNYRKNYLFIARTQFHRSISAAIQQAIYAVQETDWRVMNLVRCRKSFKQNVERKIADRLPAGHAWRGHFFYLPSTAVGRIMDTLISSGILDTTVSRCLFSIGIKSVEDATGGHCLVIYVGYAFDLNEDLRYSIDQ